MIEFASTLQHYPIDLLFLFFNRQHIKVHCLINSPGQPYLVERLEQETVAGVSIYIQVVYCIVNPADIVGYRKGSVDSTYHHGYCG